MDTVTLKIDGRDITTEKGKTILQAALDNGISIPYYCYHPGIGVDGSCRVCIVKVEKMPKLQTSCSTVCSDGMVVETRSREVIEAHHGRIRLDSTVGRGTSFTLKLPTVSKATGKRPPLAAHVVMPVAMTPTLG